MIHIIPKFVIGREEGWEEGRGKGKAGEIYFLSNLRCPRQKERLL